MSKQGQPQNNNDPKKGFKPSWITQGLNSQGIEFCSSFGESLKNEGLSTSQFRSIYGEVKKIQSKNSIATEKTTFLLLRPKVAYAAKRANKPGSFKFKDVFIKAHKAVNPDEPNGLEQRFQNFCDLLEAVLAYHKAAGGE